MFSIVSSAPPLGLDLFHIVNHLVILMLLLFQSKVAELEIKVVAIHTNNQLADQFTKGLPAEKFVRDRKQLMGW